MHSHARPGVRRSDSSDGEAQARARARRGAAHLGGGGSQLSQLLRLHPQVALAGQGGERVLVGAWSRLAHGLHEVPLDVGRVGDLDLPVAAGEHHEPLGRADRDQRHAGPQHLARRHLAHRRLRGLGGRWRAGVRASGRACIRACCWVPILAAAA